MGALNPTITCYHIVQESRVVHYSKLIVEWQRWVNMSRHSSAMARPVYHQQRTYLMSVATAVECQEPT